MNKTISKRKLFSFLFILTFSSILGYITPISLGKSKISEIDVQSGTFCNRAEWRETNGQYYLEIFATDHYNLGKLKGEYLADQIITLDQIINELLFYYEIPMDLFIFLSYIYNLYIPHIYRTEIYGISKAIPSLSYTDILLQIVFLDLFYGILNPIMTSMGKLAGCTAIVINDENNVIGQNMDFGLIFFPTLSWVKASISGISIFSLYIGAAMLPIGKSEYVSSLVTLVQTNKIHQIFSTPTMIKTQIAFENAKNANEFMTYLTDGYTCSWNFIIADENNVIASETINPICVEEEVGENSFAVRTNTYITEELEQYLIDPLYCKERQFMAEYLASCKLSTSTSITVIDLMEILSYYDTTNNSICRLPNPSDPLSTCTLSFFTYDLNNKTGYFGLGNTILSSWGIIPE